MSSQKQTFQLRETDFAFEGRSELRSPVTMIMLTLIG